MSLQFERVYPQNAVQPISSLLRRDVQSTNDFAGSNLDSTQKFLQVGDTIPVVFCRRIDNIGGAFISPPAARFGIENSGDSVTTRVAVVLSDGCIPQMPTTDIYIGAEIENVAGTVTCNGINVGFNGFINVNQQFYTVTRQYETSTVASGVPTTQTSSNKATGSGKIEINSTDNNCISLSTTISGTYQLEAEGNGLDGYPKYIVNKFYIDEDGDSIQDDPKHYVNIEKRKYRATATAGITWNRTETSEVNPVRTNRRRVKIVFDQPYRFATSLFPANEFILPYPTGNFTIDAGRIRSYLFNAYATASSAVNELTNVSFAGTRDPDVYISSGTTMSVLKDQFSVSVTEVAQYDYPLPTGYPSFGGSGGTFAGMTTLGVIHQHNIVDNQYMKQIHVFIRNGIQITRLLDNTYGSSNNFADLVLYFMQQNALVPSDLIDTTRLFQAAQFTNAQGFFFNGILASSVNLREWLDRICPYFLLKVSQVDGRYGLVSALPLNGTALNTGAITPAFTFDNTNVIDGSFSRSSVDAADLRPFCALMAWRDQPTSGPGITRITEVRYGGTAINGPFEQYDMSDFCTSEAHAIKAGRYILSRRRRITHTASWDTTEVASGLNPNDIVRVSLSTADSRTGTTSNYSEMFQIDSIRETPTGLITIEATLFPVDTSGRSLIALDVNNGI